jgi:hypothetical protein
MQDAKIALYSTNKLPDIAVTALRDYVCRGVLVKLTAT